MPATQRSGIHHGTETPASTTDTAGAWNGMMPVAQRIPMTIAPVSSPLAASASGGRSSPARSEITK